MPIICTRCTNIQPFITIIWDCCTKTAHSISKTMMAMTSRLHKNMFQQVQ
ncbi:unnamed protein product [Brugia timori]|uniref:Uncharacterized protein n=1 Tax=Brugia timori TaxID=42155 RepID=A0A3P7ZW76_9BILA|nr:unnamed protein product [Brugia timori]